MKEITIDNLKYNIDCNALTLVKYKSFFKTGIIHDLQTVYEYAIRNAAIQEDVNKSMNIDTDEVIIKATQIAWILIYTANNQIESYENWLKSIKNLTIDSDWIAEVTEYAVDCFC